MRRWGTVAYRVVTACVTCFLALTFALPAKAATQGVVRNPNGGSYVNVRSWPSYDADIIAYLPVGNTVEVTGTTGTWYSVWTEGVVGYIHANFLSVGDDGSGGWDGSYASVRSGPLNLREAPSMRARIITKLPTGYRLSVLQDEGTWVRVDAGGQMGYVMASYLTRDGSGGTTPKPPIDTAGANATIRTAGSNLNLRAYASSMAPILDVYANGSRVRVITHGAGWSQVQAGSKTGYMSSAYLVLDEGSSGTPGDGWTAVVNNPGAGQVLNLRAQPVATSASLGQYHNGKAVTVLGMGTEWCRVEVDGQRGYMMTKYLRVTGAGATPHKTVTGGANGYVNLRTGAGYGYSVIKRVSNGAAASVVTPYATWSRVMVRDGAGYVTGYMLNNFLR